MQENQRNGQDDSDIVETSEHFTVTHWRIEQTEYLVSGLSLA